MDKIQVTSQKKLSDLAGLSVFSSFVRSSVYEWKKAPHRPIGKEEEEEEENQEGREGCTAVRGARGEGTATLDNVETKNDTKSSKSAFEFGWRSRNAELNVCF